MGIIISFFKNNYQWIFSGVGIFVFSFFFYRENSQKQVNGKKIVNIQARNDISLRYANKDDSISLQAKRDININRGLTYSDVKEIALDVFKKNTAALLNVQKGFAKSGQKQKKELLIEHYDKALEIDSQNAEIYFNRGVAKYDLDNKAAIKDFNKALEINPEFIDAYISRGLAKNALGQHEAAIKDFNKALEINPKYARTYINRGIVTLSSILYEVNIEDDDKILAAWTSTHRPLYLGIHWHLGTLKLSLGKHESAIEHFSKIIKIEPRDAKAYYYRGLAKHNSGYKKGAWKDIDKARKLDPKLEISDLS